MRPPACCVFLARRLCAWVVETRAWERVDGAKCGYDDETAGAVEAVARGRPRPGHSVLGVGTFKVGRRERSAGVWWGLRDDAAWARATEGIAPHEEGVEGSGRNPATAATAATARGAGAEGVKGLPRPPRPPEAQALLRAWRRDDRAITR